MENNAFEISNPTPLRKLFKMTFLNGYTVSVAFGENSFSDKGRTTAEIAIWDADGNWYMAQTGDVDLPLVKIDNGTDVISNCTPEVVAWLMDKVRKIQ